MLVTFVMVGVAFLTLLERRVFGYIHIRNGLIGWDLLVFFSLLEVLLSYFLQNSIFLWFPIILFIIFLHFFLFVGLVVGSLLKRFYYF
jgi:hypothetical protein